MNSPDILVIGAGVLGLATARELMMRHPDAKLTVIEKEGTVGAHQTGRNSGVIHSGIYYTPGSLKARNCVRGRSLMEAYCEEHDVAWEKCGKVIVASDETELDALETIRTNGVANGVPSRIVDGEEIRAIEPHVRGVRGLHVPDTGIADYRGLATSLSEDISRRGGVIRLSERVTGIRRMGSGFEVQTGTDRIETELLVTCAGLHSDRVAAMTGDRPDIRIIPFRGEYYRLRDERTSLCRGLIYPVPDPRFPFLGVHLTREVGGGVTCGPNAVLALAREGYDWTTVSAQDLWSTFSWAGFRKLASANLAYGMSEVWRSFSRAAFARSLQKLVPEVRADDLLPASAGVRAQALDREGNLVDDYVLAGTEGVVHVCNAPSPAATSSLAIAETIADRLLSA